MALDVQKGQTLLVHAAAGGVGMAAVEIGKILGATVIATAGGARKTAFARAHGADHVIDYSTADFRDEVLKLTGGRGVDRVYDPVGGEVFAQSLRCMAVEGRICPIGFAGGTIPQIPANILLIKTIAVTGFNYGYYVGWSPHDARFEQAERTFALMERIRGWCEAGLCRPHVDRTFRLDQAAEAMRALLERSVTGRVAIVMNRVPPRSQSQQISVAGDRRMHGGRSQAVPEARLVRRKHRPLQILLERLQDGHAAKAGAGDQHAVGASRTRRLDLRVERFDLLLEAHAVAGELGRRQVAPLSARIVAQVPGRFETMIGVVAQARGHEVVAEPGRQDQERPSHCRGPQSRLGVQTVRGDDRACTERGGQTGHNGLVPALAAQNAARAVRDDDRRKPHGGELTAAA